MHVKGHILVKNNFKIPHRSTGDIRNNAEGKLVAIQFVLRVLCYKKIYVDVLSTQKLDSKFISLQC